MHSLPAQYRPASHLKEATLHLPLSAAGAMTAASAMVLVANPVWGTAGVLLFGFGTVRLERQRRVLGDDEIRARISPFRQLRRGDVDGFAWLLRVLAEIDGRSPRARRNARIALETIAAEDRLMRSLIFHCRRNDVSVEVFRDRLRRFGTGTLAATLASLHPDGRVRVAAVAAMGRRLRPVHLPFLVERTVDWAPQVRTPAQRVLRRQLRRRPALLPQVRAAYARVARRRHAPVVAQLIGGR
ncbi:hypothetical protein [Catellatospora paridis]|uniref:hypothetical protein n=1 Tax=Catellatospora paridis TaxID=1617086 RepID=UPI0012D402F0|nr:hypothetical protein [Catellatospora paridis]